MRFVAELRSWLLHQRTQAAEATAKLQAAPVSLLDVERQANTALAEVEAIHRLLDAKPKPPCRSSGWTSSPSRTSPAAPTRSRRGSHSASRRASRRRPRGQPRKRVAVQCPCR